MVCHVTGVFVFLKLQENSYTGWKWVKLWVFWNVLSAASCCSVVLWLPELSLTKSIHVVPILPLAHAAAAMKHPPAVTEVQCGAAASPNSPGNLWLLYKILDKISGFILYVNPSVKLLCRLQQNQKAFNPQWYLLQFSCVQPSGVWALASIRSQGGSWDVFPLTWSEEPVGSLENLNRAACSRTPHKAACAERGRNSWVLQRLWSLNVAMAGVSVEGVEIHK